jgi:uncharacterized membrane protein
MDIGYAVLRLVHVFAAVFWVGSTIVMMGYIQPAVRASGPAGTQFMQNLVGRRLPVAMNVSALLTIIAGLLLYARDSGGFQARAWLATPPAQAWGIGGLIGIVALLVGLVAAWQGQRLGRLGAEIQAGGGPPSAEQNGRLERLQARLNTLARLNLALLMVALVLMVIARAL